ncbi:MAG: sulfatase [Planctomycetota bacterium]
MRILHLDIDALRPDHLGCYGYHRDTSPTIDTIAKDAVRFEEVYCSDAPCLPSRTALYSGRFGFDTGVTDHGHTHGQPRLEPRRNARDLFTIDGLPGRLARAGYRTVLISGFHARHSAHWFAAGFTETIDTRKGGMEIVSDVQPHAESWLREHADEEDWYLHVNYWDVHTPYRTPMDYGHPFENEPLPGYVDDALIERWKNKVGPHSPKDVGRMFDDVTGDHPRDVGRCDTMDGARKAIDGYDTAIRYVDDAIAKLMAILDDLGVADDTAIVITADHGENMGELGIWGEHATADAATCHIPLIVKWPGKKPGVHAGLQYHLDWSATVLDLLGMEPSGSADGKSFAGVFDGEDPPGREALVFSQGSHTCQRSVRWNDGNRKWLHIQSYHDGYHLFPDDMLFDLADDPYEQSDIAVHHADVVDRAKAVASEWVEARQKKLMARGVEPTDPLVTTVAEGGPFYCRNWWITKGDALPYYLDRLEKTGRAEGAAKLREKYTSRA